MRIYDAEEKPCKKTKNKKKKKKKAKTKTKQNLPLNSVKTWVMNFFVYFAVLAAFFPVKNDIPNN